MSDFAVTVETIGEIRPHSNADRLEIAKLASMDFQFIVQKGVYKAGDWVVYFPVDSLLPDTLAMDLGLQGKLGRNNRVKTIKLRGEISQGVVAPVRVFDMNPNYSFGEELRAVPDAEIPTHDFSAGFGVTKYEAPEVSEQLIKHGRTRSLPADQHVYDIESVQRFPETADFIKTLPYVITEKLEGSHYSIVLDDNGVHICSRRLEVKSDDRQHTWFQVTDRYDLENKIKELMVRLVEAGNHFSSVALHGELVGPGVQGNIYNLPAHQLFFFDIILDGNVPVPADLFIHHMEQLNLPVVPVLRLPWGIEIGDFVEYSNGKSALKPDILREGIVIRTYSEELVDQQGRRILLKVRSPEYLAKSEL